jgi:hypothetical protein
MSVTKITGTGLGLPTADGNALGGVSNEWSDFYLADGGIIYFGNSQEITLTHTADDGLVLKHVGTGDGKEPSLTFQAGDNDIAAADVLGSIFFQAPDENTGSDAILVAAGIEAVAEGDFSAISNATSLYFKTGASEAATTKMTLSSAGALDVTGDVTGLTLNADGDTAASDAAAMGYTAAEGLILTGQGSTNDVTIKNDADADVITIATGGTAVDVVGALTAGSVASDAGVSGTTGTFTSGVSGTTGTFTSTVDINGNELILDADADTSITSDTDDTIDIKIAGADDFQFSVNAFNVLSGSTLTIDSGATIVNSGTATNFGADTQSAYAGVLQANANFVDQVIFGPSVDGQSWNGLWNKASVFSSLMLATIEDEGSNTEINIWDLTEQTSGVISTTPLATVDLSAAATPTSIAACMGYLIVGSEDGIAIIDPHDGTWAERTQGWPRSLSTSTSPALTDNDVQNVDAGFSNQPALDNRTGRYMPTFAVSYGTGADLVSVLKNEGVVYDKATTARGAAVEIVAGRLLVEESATLSRISPPINSITADDWTHWAFIDSGGNEPYGIAAAPDAMDSVGDFIAFGAGEGLSLSKGILFTEQDAVDQNSRRTAIASITRAYNTGYAWFWQKGIWLANSKTVDRTALANTLTETGTVTEAAVESGAELMGYSGFSGDNYLGRADDADWNSVGTGSAYSSIWFKSDGSDADEELIEFGVADLSYRFTIRGNWGTSGGLIFMDDGATANVQLTTAESYDDNVWHKADFVRMSSTKRYMYVDGVLVGSSTTDAGSLTAATVLRIGIASNSTARPAATSTLSLAKYSKTTPNATQIRQMYDDEKGMFVANAECLLQSGSTDAVLDVSIDPLGSGKVIVTQTDAITIFDGLAIDSKPTVNSGASEKGKLWGDLRAEQNAANAYVTAPATDQRQVNEMVRGLASDLPAGPDLWKAKAYVNFNANSGAIVIKTSFNIKSAEYVGTGNYNFFLGTKMKNRESVAMSVSVGDNSGFAYIGSYDADPTSDSETKIYVNEHDGSWINSDSCTVIWYGELENE